MKNKVYIIEILCKDTDTTIYNDNYRVGYSTYEVAKKNLNRLIQDEYKSANGWLYKIMMTCGAYSRNELDINKVIEELNKEHNWLIEVYKKGDE